MKNLLLAVSLPALLTGCAATKPPKPSSFQSTSYETLYLDSGGRIVSKSTKAGKPVEPGWWKGDGIPGKPSIVIDLSDQKASFFKGGVLVGQSPVSTGREGYRTPSGQFSIIQKNEDHVSNLYGDYVDASGTVVVKNIGIMEDARPAGTKFRGAPMPYFMRITRGVGMHAGFLPGVPDSHGCIRMPRNMAQVFFENVSVGTPVAVRY